VEGLKEAFKRLDGVKDVRFDWTQTAFIVEAASAIRKYQQRFSALVENWEHYSYQVKNIETSQN